MALFYLQYICTKATTSWIDLVVGLKGFYRHFYTQTDRQTDRNVYLTKINKLHNDNIYNNCGREFSTKTIYRIRPNYRPCPHNPPP